MAIYGRLKVDDIDLIPFAALSLLFLRYSYLLITLVVDEVVTVIDRVVEVALGSLAGINFRPVFATRFGKPIEELIRG